VRRSISNSVLKLRLKKDSDAP